MPNAQGNPTVGDPDYVAPAQSGGLINTATTPVAGTVTGFTPASTSAVTADSTGYDATKVNVAPDQTVASNISGIVAADSPLMQQAASRAMQQSNARGLLNSTQAISAGQSAVYDAAMPIASQDAATYNTAALANANAANTASQFTAGAKNTAANLNAQLGTGVNSANAAATNTALGQQAAATNTSALSAQQAVDQTARDSAATLAATNAAAKLATTNTARDSAATLAATNTATALAATNTAAATAKAAADTAMQTADQTFKTAYQTADAKTKEALAGIEADYKTLMQTSSSAGDLYKSTMVTMSQIMQDPNMDSTSKQTAINNITKGLKSGLAFLGSVNGIDVTALLPTEPLPT